MTKPEKALILLALFLVTIIVTAHVSMRAISVGYVTEIMQLKTVNKLQAWVIGNDCKYDY